MHDTARTEDAEHLTIVCLAGQDADLSGLTSALAASGLAGSRFVPASTRAAALEALGQDAQVLIVDLGAEVNRDGHWRNLPGLYPEVPLLVLGGEEDRAACLAALAAGAQDCLSRDGLSPLGLERCLRFSLARCRTQARERKRLAELETRAERLASLVNENPDGILVVDDEGLVVFVNLAARLLLGRSERELLGRPFGFPVLQDGVGELDIQRKGSDRAVAEMRVAEIDWGERNAYLVSLRDVSDHRRRARDQSLRIQAEKLVTAISTEFVTLDASDTDCGIRDALKLLGEFCRVDRAVVYLYGADGRLLTNAYEWAASGVSAQAERSYELLPEDLGWLMDRLTIFETVLVAGASELPEEAEGERELLAARGVASLVAVAMNQGGTRHGLLGFESVRRERMWSEEEIGLLKIVGDIFCAALTRRRTEAAMRAEAWLMRQLVGNVRVGILAEDERGRVALANPALCELFEAAAPPDALRGQDGEDLMRTLANITVDPKHFLRRTREILTLQQTVSGEKVQLRDGRILEYGFAPLREGDAPRGQLWFFSDATDAVKTERRLEALVRRDLLTGLASRHRFLEDLAVVLSKTRTGQERVALIVLDVDDLRRINAELGFVAGDKVLKQAAARLAEQAGETVLLGRISGDEFAAVVPGVGGFEEAEAVARNLAAALSAPYVLAGRAVALTVSAGVSLFPDQADGTQSILQKADRALQAAKAGGKNAVRVYGRE